MRGDVVLAHSTLVYELTKCRKPLYQRQCVIARVCCFVPLTSLIHPLSPLVPVTSASILADQEYTLPVHCEVPQHQYYIWENSNFYANTAPTVRHSSDEYRKACGTAAESHAASQGERRLLTLKEKPVAVSAQHNQLWGLRVFLWPSTEPARQQARRSEKASGVRLVALESHPYPCCATRDPSKAFSVCGIELALNVRIPGKPYAESSMAQWAKEDRMR